MEAIGEVKVTTNSFTAEFGRSSGYQAASVIKSGASDFHGEGVQRRRIQRSRI
jgi:hypothetical protein